MTGHWQEIINTDSELYGGSGKGNMGGFDSESVKAHGRDQSLSLTLPPLATLIFRLS
jgi:1,4-alpha-glucan branching enzyme